MKSGFAIGVFLYFQTLNNDECLTALFGTTLRHNLFFIFYIFLKI